MPGPPPGGAAAGSCFFMSSMAPAVWYRLGSFLGSDRPDRPDLGALPLAPAALIPAAEIAESSAAEKSGSGEASEARVSQLSPEGEGGMPTEYRERREGLNEVNGYHCIVFRKWSCPTPKKSIRKLKIFLGSPCRYPSPQLCI